MPTTQSGGATTKRRSPGKRHKPGNSAHGQSPSTREGWDKARPMQFTREGISGRWGRAHGPSGERTAPHEQTGQSRTHQSREQESLTRGAEPTASAGTSAARIIHMRRVACGGKWGAPADVHEQIQDLEDDEYNDATSARPAFVVRKGGTWKTLAATVVRITGPREHRLAKNNKINNFRGAPRQ